MASVLDRRPGVLVAGVEPLWAAWPDMCALAPRHEAYLGRTFSPAQIDVARWVNLETTGQFFCTTVRRDGDLRAYVWTALGEDMLAWNEVQARAMAMFGLSWAALAVGVRTAEREARRRGAESFAFSWKCKCPLGALARRLGYTEDEVFVRKPL